MENIQQAGKYEGELVDGLRHGKGKLILENQSVYEGNFDKGCFQGEGTQIYEDGRKYVGQFQNNKFNGPGTFEWVNGYRFEGIYKDSRRLKGIFYFSKVQFIETEYNNKGQPSGYGFFNDENQQKKAVKFENGYRILVNPKNQLIIPKCEECNSHLIAVETNENNNKCSKCSFLFKETNPRFQCKQEDCNTHFQLCLTCIEEFNKHITLKKVMEDEVLKKGVYDIPICSICKYQCKITKSKEGFMCNMCSREVDEPNNVEDVFHCELCNFDTCLMCLKQSELIN